MIGLVVRRDDQNPARGCYTSHVSAWRELSARGVKHALILEDDASLLRTWDACKLSANAWLDASFR